MHTLLLFSLDPSLQWSVTHTLVDLLSVWGQSDVFSAP